MPGFSGFLRLAISLLTLISAFAAFGPAAKAGDDCYSRTVGDWTVIDDAGCMLELSRTLTSGTDGIQIVFLHEGSGRYQLTVYSSDYMSGLSAVSVDFSGSAAVPASEMSFYGRYTADLGTEIASVLYTGGYINIHVTYPSGNSAVFMLGGADFKLAVDSVP